MPVSGGVAHKVEHGALAHHPHRAKQKQRPLAHKTKTHHVEAKHHQGHDQRPLCQIADNKHHFEAVQRGTEHKLFCDVAVKHRHQRQEHNRVDHEEDPVASVVKARHAQGNHPGKHDPQRLTKVVGGVDDVAVRGKDPRQGINRHDDQ